MEWEENGDRGRSEEMLRMVIFGTGWQERRWRSEPQQPATENGKDKVTGTFWNRNIHKWE